LLAAVDLGSNSFRLLIGRVEHPASACRCRPLDNLKESVRLAAGLTPEGMIDARPSSADSRHCGRFAERLRSFSPDGCGRWPPTPCGWPAMPPRFQSTAEAALGFPIDIIAGLEEARLIYTGAAHALATTASHRLVIDIGGGSTECIVGCRLRRRRCSNR
jgi:exopolyphosphatase/guanosine-5'-triphosphate,3'-diphosphate pyrophosphatase